MIKNGGYWQYLKKEDMLCVAITDFLNLNPFKCLWFHVPNEGKRTRFEQFKFKVLGGIAGVSDYYFLYKGKSLFLEVKRYKNAKKKTQGTKLTEKQSEFLEYAKKNGAYVSVVRCFDEFVETITDFFNMVDEEEAK